MCGSYLTAVRLLARQLAALKLAVDTMKADLDSFGVWQKYLNLVKVCFCRAMKRGWSSERACECACAFVGVHV